MYTVIVSQRVEPDDEYFPNGRMRLKRHKVHTLAAAKALADERMGRSTGVGIVIEVEDREGRIKYRIERNPCGDINRDMLV